MTAPEGTTNHAGPSDDAKASADHKADHKKAPRDTKRKGGANHAGKRKGGGKISAPRASQGAKRKGGGDHAGKRRDKAPRDAKPNRQGPKRDERERRPHREDRRRDRGDSGRPGAPHRPAGRRKDGKTPRRPAPTLLKFAKMHGLGNDFMVVDLISQDVAPEALVERAATWGDRQRGVGFDQLLLVLPPDDPQADFRCRTFNADGGEAERCGNGARCVARFVVAARLTRKRDLALQMGNTTTRAELLGGTSVRVELGVPSVEPAEVPFVCDGDGLAQTVELPNASVEVTAVSVGNPHAVILVDDVEAADVAGVGAALQAHERFPERVNVGFLQTRSNDSGRLRVYERGVGETNACGSGAAAAMVAARLRQRWKANRAKIALPGGPLWVEWQGAGAPIKIEGPTQLVFKGQLRL